jgi:hypothetical protein
VGNARVEMILSSIKVCKCKHFSYVLQNTETFIILTVSLFSCFVYLAMLLLTQDIQSRMFGLLVTNYLEVTWKERLLA